MWMDLHGAIKAFGAWPDGKTYLEQPNILIEIVNIIEDQIDREKKIDSDRRGLSGN